MSSMLVNRIIHPILLSLLAIFIAVSLVGAATYELDATPNQYAGGYFNSWSLVYQDLVGDGLYRTTDPVISFTGFSYTGTIPSIDYSTPILAAPQNSMLSPFTSGNGCTIGGTYYPNDWDFTPSRNLPGLEGGVYAGVFNYTQTAVPLPPSALLLGSGLLGLAATRLIRLGRK